MDRVGDCYPMKYYQLYPEASHCMLFEKAYCFTFVYVNLVIDTAGNYA